MNILVNLGKMFGIIPAPMVDTVSCVMRGRAILDANRLGVFRALEVGPRTVAELAQETGTSLVGLEALLAALAACGYLVERRGRYENGRWVRKWILDSGMGLCHFLEVQENVWERAATLGECVRTGQAVQNPHDSLVMEPSAAADGYVRGMRQISQLLIPHFARHVRLPANSRRLIDLGGSHGDYSRALLRHHPTLRPVVFDLPGPVAAAEKMALERGDTGSIDFRAGNLLTDDIGTGWDAALMISVLHVFNPDQARTIFRKVAAGLRPGGTFAVLDHLRGVSRSRDNVVAMMGLNYLTLGGRSYALPEVTDLMKEAGFSRVAVTRLPIQIGATLVQATR